ncbi:hypothetical protein HMP0721_0493 [Pseudoramibacter alactolyticus ATCC 23263]|uniref:Uncharacterized protein n=1 Tax=Pseudoramibacter alactolyticus ATCC 23263 TaxID=887929 RepID=E6MER0_9FIRM|nr:hypothetical protein [Pseudoramibacter alactolyticus]EFV02585.1 hypothetical protein HMP0721_0493 [Pseudoramibacter alactolyticus ATCC 23263]
MKKMVDYAYDIAAKKEVSVILDTDDKDKREPAIRAFWGEAEQSEKWRGKDSICMT